MKNLNLKKTVVKTLVITSILFSAFSCEKDAINNDDSDNIVQNDNVNDDTVNNGDDNQTKAAYPTIGVILGDDKWGTNKRGVIEISGGGAYFDLETCQWVFALPLTTVVMPCQYPNGFCQTTYVSGTTGSNNGELQDVALPGGGTTTTSPGGISLNFPCATTAAHMVKIHLPGGNNPGVEGVIDMLKRDQVSVPDGETYESLADNIVNTFNIPNDTPLSDELTEDIRKANPDVVFGHVTVLKASYPITYTDEEPNGYIHALVKISTEDSTSN